MADDPNRWTWIAGPDPGVVCRAYLAFIPERGAFVCWVLTSARLAHYFGPTATEAELVARRHVEDQHGTIRGDQPLRCVNGLRIARWHSAPALVGGDDALQLDEEWISSIAGRSELAARGYFARTVMAAFPEETHEREHRLLKRFVAEGDWSAVPVDALFASSHPDLDYQPE